MSDTLKIMVRETKTERRALTREEMFAMGAADSQHNTSTRARVYLQERGFVRGSYMCEKSISRYGEYGSGEFRTVEVRDAYVDEIEAWHAYGIGYHISEGFAAWNLLVDESRVILKDKEILFEVVKGDEATDD